MNRRNVYIVMNRSNSFDDFDGSCKVFGTQYQATRYCDRLERIGYETKVIKRTTMWFDKQKDTMKY